MELNKFNTQSDIVIRSMIEGSNKKAEKSNRLMSDNLTSQEEMLNKRMQERSRSKKKLETPTNRPQWSNIFVTIVSFLIKSI